MNGLKTVWIISRHFKSEDKMQNLLNLISDEIADKVENEIKIQNLFKLNNESVSHETQLQ